MFLLEHQDRQTDTHTLHNFIRKQKDLGFHVEQWHYKTMDKLKLYKVKKKTITNKNLSALPENKTGTTFNKLKTANFSLSPYQLSIS